MKDTTLKNRLYDSAVDVFCKTGIDISFKIIKKEDFERMKSIRIPFIDNILKEGIKIG